MTTPASRDPRVQENDPECDCGDAGELLADHISGADELTAEQLESLRYPGEHDFLDDALVGRIANVIVEATGVSGSSALNAATAIRGMLRMAGDDDA